MPVCYICSQNFNLTTGLFLHFKIVHNLEFDSKYGCREGLCRRDFSTSNSFRKHLNEKHTVKELINEVFSLHNVSEINTEADILKINAHSNFDKLDDTFDNFENALHDSILKFLAKLYSHSAIPRNTVQLIVEQCTNFFNSEFMNLVSTYVLNELAKCLVHKESLIKVKHSFKRLKNPFEGFTSEYHRLKALANTNCFIKPCEYKVGQKSVELIKEGRVSIIMKDIKASFIPLRTVLKYYFEMPNILQKSLDFISNIKDNDETSTVTNFVQSKFWKNKLLQFKNKTVFPLFLYYDDYESCNPLGSHSGVYKIGALYVSLPFLPSYLQGSLDRILLFQLHHSQDRREFGNKAIFTTVVEELTYLEKTGISIETQGGKYHIYFSLALIVGDNLGLHTILGFSESFVCNFPCRFCKVTRCESKVLCTQNDNLLRTFESYDQDLLQNNVTLTGIKESCIWNSLTFHVTDNLSVDIMHDILEGVCHYDFLVLLKRFLYDMNYLTLDNLNFRISTFNYSDFEIKNKPPPVTQDFLKKTKLHMSASEMLCFTRYFGLIVGDLIPELDGGWQLYLSLRQIMDIIFSRSVSQSKVTVLKTLIEEHHTIYLSNIFQGNSLKPKHHHMIHYPYIMSEVGPLRNLWSMRFESKHKDSKKTANITCSRKNITLTLAMKHQLKLCYKFLSKDDFDNNIFIGPGEIVVLSTLNFYERFRTMLPENIVDIFAPHWININGLIFKPSVIIIVGTNELLPIFGKLLYLLQIEDIILFVYSCLDTLGFNEHYHAYEVKNIDICKITTYSDLLDPYQAVLHTSVDGNMYIAVRYDISGDE